MRVLVCGSRDFDDKWAVWYALSILSDVTAVIEGGATGADALAKAWVERHNELNPRQVEHLPFPANWLDHAANGCNGNCAGSKVPRNYCSRAGFVRNQRMLDEGKPDLCLGFVNKPRAHSRGTNGMVLTAVSAGIRTYVLEAL